MPVTMVMMWCSCHVLTGTQFQSELWLTKGASVGPNLHPKRGATLGWDNPSQLVVPKDYPIASPMAISWPIHRRASTHCGGFLISKFYSRLHYNLDHSLAPHTFWFVPKLGLLESLFSFF